jgi:hypothetical protein
LRRVADGLLISASRAEGRGHVCGFLELAEQAGVGVELRAARRAVAALPAQERHAVDAELAGHPVLRDMRLPAYRLPDVRSRQLRPGTYLVQQPHH